MTRPNATDAQLTRIETSMTDNTLYDGDWDRLWKICEMARLWAETCDTDDRDGSPLDPEQATKIIGWMTRKGYVPKAQQQRAERDQRVARRPYPKVPAGRYATDSRTGSNDTDFWLIEVPTEGKWAGYSFVRRVIGGRADQKIRGPEALAALEAIEAAGFVAARERFADELEQCWRCGIHLTDDDSRALRIGPDCCKAEYGMTQTQRLAALAPAR